MRGGQEGPSKKLSALKWGSECTSSRQIPGGGIQQPPRRLPGLRCETRTCPLQALLCEGTKALLCEGTEGSWGAVPESQKSQAGMPHTAPPDLDFHSTQLPLPPAPRPLPQSGSLRGGGGGGGKVAGRQHEHQGQGQHRTTSYHIREEQSGRRGALFPPWQGWAPAPRAAARWGFRPAWVVGAQPDLTTWLAGGRPRESHPRAPQPLSVGICPLSPGLSSQEPEFPKPLEPLLPHPAPAPFPAVHFYICSRLLLQHPACTRQEWKMEKVSGRQRRVTLTLSEARSLAQRKWPN